MITLFQSIAVLGAIFGSLLTWPVSDNFGRQTALKVGGVPSLCGWLLLSNSVRITESFAGFQAALLTGRFLTGFGVGWSLPTVSVGESE